MKEPKVTVMLLAGGQGSRLKMLTNDLAKPAVPYGGKYRIIDFPLSNCSNSRMYNVGILTEYKPYLLNTHIGIGQPWDLNRRNGGARVLPPFMNEDGGRWYRGTANAIYENISYLDGLETDYVIILSGDHIYKMDYNDIVAQHIDKGADATISVIEVPWEEASRFGVLSIDKDDRIVEFQEKPEKPKSNLASMGIYVFSWSTLKEYLVADEQDKESSNDFGKNIIPNYKNDGKKLFAYKFSGYWKDVGTVSSYWQANMDLLDNDNELNLYDKSWRIYSSNMHLPPHFITRDAVVKNVLINEGCLIEGEVKNSVLFNKITVEKGAKINKSVILSGAKISSGAVINNAVVMENVHVKADTVIGDESEEGIFYLVDTDQTMKCE